jgi:acyl-CoA oxidase
MLETGSTGALEDLHLQTVAAKVYSTEIASRGVETCRIACGGHGYSALSGFGRMYAHTVNAVTYEGDNYVISQQVTRAIMKYLRSSQSSSTSKPAIPASLSYLRLLQQGNQQKTPNIDSEAAWLTIPVQSWALESRLARLVQQHIDDSNQGRDTSYSSHALTMAHSDYVYWKGLWAAVQKIEDPPAQQKYAHHMRALAHVVSLFDLQIFSCTR